MRQTKSSVALNGVIALSLSLFLMSYPGARTAATVSTSGSVTTKTEAQFKAEASSYEKTLLAISRISSSNLDTPEALKQALEVFKQQRTNLNFHRSKLVVRAFNDPTFSAAVKKAASSVKDGEKLIKDLIADRSAVLKLDGAKNLVSVLSDSRQKDAAILKQAGDHLKAASEKIKASADKGAFVPGASRLQLVRANYLVTDTSNPEFATAPVMIDPVTVIASVALAAAVIVATIFITTAIQNLYQNLFTEEGRDAVTDCQRQSDERLSVCLTSAGRLSFPLNIAAEGLCFSQWALDQAQCLVKA